MTPPAPLAAPPAAIATAAIAAAGSCVTAGCGARMPPAVAQSHGAQPAMTRSDASNLPVPALSAAATALLPLLDAASVQRLRELDPGDRNGLIGRILDTFVGSLARHTAELAQARAVGDHAALRQVAHTLKSSSASVGALELSRACAELEQMVREGATTAIAAPLARLEAQIQRLLAVTGRQP